jgi:ectoine hydroxylase-related dioxygenase (phytanoyl-CoA dioxygenase family)
MAFRPEMKAFYEANGYLVVERLFEDGELAGVRRRTDEIVSEPESAPPGVWVGREGDTIADRSRAEAKNDAVRGLAFVARFDPVYRELALNPKLLAIVRGLLGPRVQLFRDQMLLKPPGGQSKPLHQDQSYFRVTPIDALVTAWVALDPATLENGCMAYVPGSHRHGIFPITPDPAMPVHHIPDAGGHDLPDPVLCPVPEGSVIFHHGCTLHASAENRTASWRRALILHYATAEACSEHEKLNEEVSLRID